MSQEAINWDDPAAIEAALAQGDGIIDPTELDKEIGETAHIGVGRAAMTAAGEAADQADFDEDNTQGVNLDDLLGREEA